VTDFGSNMGDKKYKYVQYKLEITHSMPCKCPSKLIEGWLAYALGAAER
jgi:hypothetical protein